LPLAIAGGGAWLAALFVAATIEPASRRLTNAAYVLFVTGANLFTLAGFSLVGACWRHHPLPPLLSFINRQQLVVFLVANVLTGLVNLSLDTLAYSRAAAVVIVLLYSLAVFLVSAGLAALLRACQSLMSNSSPSSPSSPSSVAAPSVK
jgi:phosphatidylinositol glycan class W